MAKETLLIACLGCLYLKTLDSKMHFNRKLLLLKRKQNTQANTFEGCWKVSVLNLTTQTAVKPFWKTFSFF